jgi:tetratricopeptide (TPR) repeat protein
VRRIVWAAPLAIVLFVAGALGLARPFETELPAGPAIRAAPALLGHASGADLGAAIAGLQSRIRSETRDWRSLASLGLAYLQQGRLSADPSYYPRAEGVLARSLQLEADNFEAALGMGILALGRHDFPEALLWGGKARDLNPYNAQARGVIGDALVELGRYRAAGRAFQAMVDLRPELSSYARVSYYRELTGDVPGAIEAMRMALDAAGTPADAAWAGYQLGELFFGSGRLAPAVRAYGQAGRVDPTAVLPRVGVAKVAAARGDLGRAVEILKEVVARYPAPEIVVLLGDVAGAAGRVALAARQYRLVEAMDELYRAGGVDTDLEMALFSADHPFDSSRTVRQARAAYRRRPGIQAADALAWTLYAAGRYRAAGRYAHEALRLGTRSALFHFHAGMIATAAGSETRARVHLETALAINPWFSFLHAEVARRALHEVAA